MTKSEAIEHLKNIAIYSVQDCYMDEARQALDMAIKVLEEPERKRGKWIPVTNGRGGFECDRCHCYAPSYQDGVEWLSAFCPNCGCRMEGDEHE